MMANTLMIKKMVLVFILIVTEVNLKDHGPMESRTAKVHLPMQKVIAEKAPGLMGRELNGLMITNKINEYLFIFKLIMLKSDLKVIRLGNYIMKFNF